MYFVKIRPVFSGLVTFIVCWLKIVWLTGGVDFNTTTLTATFDAGVSIISVRVQVINDSIAEGAEVFNLALDVPSSLGPAITAGDRKTAVGAITDSTGKYVQYILSCKLRYRSNATSQLNSRVEHCYIWMNCNDSQVTLKVLMDHSYYAFSCVQVSAFA